MKRLITAAGAVAALALFAGTAQAQEMGNMPEGREMTVTGTVVDISCKFGLGASGEGHRMCAQVCADAGVPLAILGSDGTLYIPTTASMPGTNQNERLKEYAEQEVRVTGTVHQAGGARAIKIDRIART